MKPQHTISRRGFITAFLGTAVAASLAACAPAQTGTPTAPSAKPTEAPTVAAKPTAAPTTAAQPTGGAAKPASKMLKLYHDKSPWNDNYNKVGSFIAQRIGVGFEGVPYPDTTTYQTAVRQALPSRTAPDLFTWWSGYRMKDLVDQGLLADLTSVWQKRIQAGELAASIADPFTFDGKVYAVSN
ncbi:MAG TPA: extracellular solute-binding protein, partial [Chloroflexota bacterium]